MMEKLAKFVSDVRMHFPMPCLPLCHTPPPPRHPSRIVPARVTSVRSKAGAGISKAVLAAAVVEDALNDGRLDPEDPGTWTAWCAMRDREQAAVRKLVLERATVLVAGR